MTKLKLALAFCVFLMLVNPALRAQTPPESPAPGTPAAAEEDGKKDGEEEDDGEEDDAKDKKKPGERFRPYFSLGADLLFFIEDSSLESDPEPVLPAFFLAFGIPVVQLNSAALFIVPSLDVYWTHYRWSDARARPVPAAIENRDEFVTGFFTGLGAEGQMRIAKSFLTRFSLGISADLRLVLVADGLNSDVDPVDQIKEDTKKVNDYFWEAKNLLFAHAALGFDFRALENYTVGIGVKAWMPFSVPSRYANDSPLLGWRFGVMINFARLIGQAAPKKPESEPEEAAPESESNSNTPHGDPGAQ
jgi:hypothetical protein